MNNESPLIPQGSLLEQKNRGRARVKIAVFVVLAIHGIGVMALLMQGCRKPDDTAMASKTDTNATPVFQPQTNPVPAPDTNPAPPVTPIVEPAPVPVTPPAPAATDYKVAKGDTLGKIAKKHHVTLNALQDANPGVDSTKLKVDQVIHIPASAASAGSSSSSAPSPTAAPSKGGSEQTYKVKSGDTLTKIAGEFGLKVKALREANSLKTDKIRVGQVLKVPAKTTASLPPPVVPVPEPAASTSNAPMPGR
jgi:peptidoglycan endopeptidase LytE